MKHIKTFENYSDTNPDVIVNKEINQNGEFYSVDKTGLEGIMYYYFKEKNEITKGDVNEIKITYDYQHLGDINPEDIKNAIEYLNSIPGVETVIHRVGQCFEITFDRPVSLKSKRLNDESSLSTILPYKLTTSPILNNDQFLIKSTILKDVLILFRKGKFIY